MDVRCSRREPEKLGVFSSLHSELATPPRLFRDWSSNVKSGHVHVPFVDVKRRAAAAKEVIGGIVEILQVSAIDESTERHLSGGRQRDEEDGSNHSQHDS